MANMNQFQVQARMSPDQFMALYGDHAFNFRKYGHRYLAKAQYRFNRRFDLSALLRRFLYTAAATGKRTDASLRLDEDQCQSIINFPLSPAYPRCE